MGDDESKRERPSIAAMCAGLSGAGNPKTAESIRAALASDFPAVKIKVCTDLEIALVALGDGPAIVLIAGTGSVAVGRGMSGGMRRAGGLGPQIGDEGSATDIGRKALLAEVYREKTGEESSLGKQLLRQLGNAAKSQSPEMFPRLFPVVANAADTDDEMARGILRDAAGHLAALVKTLVKELELEAVPFRLAKTGGMIGRCAFFDDLLDGRLRHAAPLARIGLLPIFPAQAAALMALELLPGDGNEKELRMTDANTRGATPNNEPGAAQAEIECASVATAEELSALLHHESREVLLALLNNPALAEADVRVLLGRKILPADVVEEISKRREWLKVYAVKKALACHPHTPRLVSMRLLRELYLMDLVQIALLPGVSAELKRNAEDQLAARLPQLPLGQKITLGRRGPARVAGLLLVEGHPKVVEVALDNAHLHVAQILKTLASESVPESVAHAIAQHRKWSCDYNVRLALVRNPASTLATVLSFLPELTVVDLEALAAPGIVPERLRKYLEAEVNRRIDVGKKSTARGKALDGSGPSNDV